MNKKLSNLMLIANFISCLFYSASYPYIYAETLKIVPKYFISIESILACISTIIFCKMWNSFSDKLFKHYRKMLIAEIIADVYLFLDVIIRNDIKFYFLLNIIIFSVITKNIGCGGTKMRAMVNPDEKSRESFDNNSSIVNALSTLLGAGFAMFINLDLTWLFILALIGNTIDNIFYLHIYNNLMEEL